MQYRKRLLLFVICSLVCYLARSQDWKDRGYSLTGIGAGYIQPKLKNGFTSDPWLGATFRMSGAEINYFEGHATGKDDSDHVIKTEAYKFGVGMHIPVSKLALGHRVFGLRGMMLMPFMYWDVGSMGAGRAHGIDFTFAPGLSLQFPFGGLEIQYNTTGNYYRPYSEVDQILGLPQSERLATGKWFHYPQLTVHLDGLVDLLPIINVKGWGITNTKMNDYLNSGYSGTYRDNHGDLWYYYHPADESILDRGEWYTYDVNRDAIRSVWGITPKLSFMSPAYSKGPSLMYGLGLSRRKELAYDFFFEKGMLGARAPEGPREDLPSYRYQNYYNLQMWSAGLGFDFFRIISSGMFNMGEGIKGKALFERFILGWRAGQASLDAVIVDTPRPNKTLNGKPYNLVSLPQHFVNYPYISYEYGTVGFTAEFLGRKSFGYGNGIRWSVQCIVPVGGIWNAWFRNRGHRGR